MPAGAIILAAGAATRMGRIKQLLIYQGRTLVENTVHQARDAGFTPVVVVLGAEAVAVADAVARTQAQCVVNESWQAGMGSSLSTGVAKLMEIVPDIPAIAVMLADQPRVTAQHLSAMWRVFEQVNTSIVAASYAGTAGVPAIFGSRVFGKLKSLAPDAGARALLRSGEAEVHLYPLPEAAIDIDTPEDFAALD